MRPASSTDKQVPFMVILDEVPFYPKKIESRQPVSGSKAFANPLFNALLKRP